MSVANIRYFYFWCERCPTRITVETEVPADAPEGEPAYSFADFNGVGLAQAHRPILGDDGLEVANLCPACSWPLHDVDDLTARGVIPRFESDMRKLHADWRAKVRMERSRIGCPIASQVKP